MEGEGKRGMRKSPADDEAKLLHHAAQVKSHAAIDVQKSTAMRIWPRRERRASEEEAEEVKGRKEEKPTLAGSETASIGGGGGRK